MQQPSARKTVAHPSSMNPFTGNEEEKQDKPGAAGRKSLKDFVGGYGGQDWLNFKR